MGDVGRCGERGEQRLEGQDGAVRLAAQLELARALADGQQHGALPRRRDGASAADASASCSASASTRLDAIERCLPLAAAREGHRAVQLWRIIGVYRLDHR